MTPGRPELSAPVVVVVGPTASGKSDLAQASPAGWAGKW